MSFVIDSNAPYFTEFPMNSAGDAVYMTAEDSVLGNVFAIVYRAHHANPKLSVILIGAHGTSGYVDMTLDRTSRFFGACKGLAAAHYPSLVRRALAIATLRTYATMDKPLRDRLKGVCDESAAGSLGSRFRLVWGKFPGVIGSRVIDSGFISAKKIDTTMVDVIYEDSDATIDQNNELVHLLGEQLEQLFDPLSEYSPEPTERLYVPPDQSQNRLSTLDEDSKPVQDVCEELYLLQAHTRGDLLDLLQTTLIPLRIEVLKGNLPGITIARLNSVFPPTIDELFRVNNIFYEALRSALPFGAFEVMKACGATIPYFYRACMRHEAATRNFPQLLAELLEDEPEIEKYLSAQKQNELTEFMRGPSHLLNIKKLLDKLNTALPSERKLSDNEMKQVEEFYSVASGTVEAFTNRGPAKEYEDRKLGSAGRVLSEIAQGWPAELEYGWLNRRVVSIFDAVDVLEPSDTLRQLHVVFIVFTDYLVVCRPSEPIPVSSLSGLHIPFVGDMLMHAMLNDAPVDRNLPPLKVVSWSPISEVHFASYAKQYLYVFSPGIIGSYKLMQPDSDSNDLVTLLAKAKITTKTQPFHLFRLSGPEITVYSTVQELQGYKEEQNRTGVALILSKEVSERTLRKYDLNAAISLQILDRNPDEVAVTIVSRMRYHASFTIPKSEVQPLVVSELAYLLTLSLSSQNMTMLDVIITANRLSSNRLIKWASEPGKKTVHGHKKATPKQAKLLAKTARSQKKLASESSKESIMPANPGLRKIPGQIPGKQRDGEESIFMDAEEDPTAPQLDEDVSYSSYSTIPSRNTYESASSNFGSSEEAEQRDVDNWYHQLNHGYGDNESLNSDQSDVAFSTSSHSENSASIQIGAFLDRSASNLYNQNAGRAFPRIESTESSAHKRQETESSFETVASLQDSFESSDPSFVSGNTTVANENDVEDFSYLATLVDATSFHAKLPEMDSTGVYPDLRDTSLVRLGNYVMYGGNRSKHTPASSTSGSQSFSQILPYTMSKQMSKSQIIEEAGDEKTPTLKSDEFSEPKLAKTEDWIVLEQGLSEEMEREEQEDARQKATSTTEKSLTKESPQRRRRSFHPFANIESVNGWQPRPVRSGTNKTLGGHIYFPDRAEFLENSFDEDDDGHELAQDWLKWSKMTRPISTMSIATLTPGEFTTPASSAGASPVKSSAKSRASVPASQSAGSFRRMVMSSSLHTLQLASFTVQIDQKKASCPPEVQTDLESLKTYVARIYKMREIEPSMERDIRTKLTGFYELLLREDCAQIALGLLEIEWVRRTRIIELGKISASKLWRYD